MFRIVGAFLLIAACDSLPPVMEALPSAPALNDESYQIAGLRDWAIIGNDVDPGNDTLELRIAAPVGTEYVDGWLVEGKGFRFKKRDGAFVASVDLHDIPPGEHQLLLAADGETTAFAKHSFKRSHPLYVVVSTDWDTADTTEDALALQDDLHAEHPELLLTHFVGPYTFTDKELPAGREDRLLTWVKGMRDDFGDEIGLHIHPYCNFVEQVGTILGDEAIECRISPSFRYSSDSTGYTVHVSAYSEDEFTKMLLASDALFMERGLGKPTSFRAGGWTAELNTMHSLDAAGYVADTSANNWRRLDEWDAPLSGTLYKWNKEHWSEIGDTSQPYYPSKEDIQKTGPDTFNLLEVPDNGILVDYVESTEMIDIFEANWDGSALQQPVNFSIGYHPVNFGARFKARMGSTLSHVDLFLASHDRGPVIYGRVSDMALVWKRPE